MSDIILNPMTRFPVVFFFFFISLLVAVSLIIFPCSIHLVPAELGRDGELQIYPHAEAEFSPINCTAFQREEQCYPTGGPRIAKEGRVKKDTCPEFFRWIHEDLRPWAQTGITAEMVEEGREKAAFRLVIVDGRAYVESIAKSYQSRDIFTVWGILQLLRWYPGEIPDLDLMFNCGDRPGALIGDYYSGPQSNPTAPPPPPLFSYCGDHDTLDIVFPDWSYWGWAELKIKPWTPLIKDLKQGNQKAKWVDREPYAYWKGNPRVSWTRYHLMKCNLSREHDWNARVYKQDWEKENEQGFKNSNLADQCIHRYKIYIEGIGWSVSLKYILACDSVTLMVKPLYYDFFTRSLVPMEHYWPIQEEDMCNSIKFAVDWSNTHQQKAQAIGKAASKFIEEQLSMENVYDYMFHTLNEYSKLLTFKPTIPPNATEICLEQLACRAQGLATEFMTDTLIKRPSLSTPCSLPPPFSPTDLLSIRKRKETIIKQVEMSEKNVSVGGF